MKKYKFEYFAQISLHNTFLCLHTEPDQNVSGQAFVGCALSKLLLS